jgi:predicted nucleotidyltransferase component of viral defense system
MTPQVSPKKMEQGALLQLILLHCLYSQSGSESIVFQGGTALRWVYGGQRASEDLDFVCSAHKNRLMRMMEGTFHLARSLATAQFGPGSFEQKPVQTSKALLRTYAIFRPENQRERIAVRIEVEELRFGVSPESRKTAFMDCPPVFGVMREGSFALPFSSSILNVETPAEILTDKLRALLERPYLKGRDLYDLWFLYNMLGARADLIRLKQKLDAYARPFRPARKATFFLQEETRRALHRTLESDLRPFLPPAVYRELAATKFAMIFHVLNEILPPLVEEGLEELINQND